MRGAWFAFPLCIVCAGLALSQVRPDAVKPPDPKDLEADIRVAKAGGKYAELLAVLRVPDDLARYGAFHDFGRWSAAAYAGHENLPRGYWVYVHPNWFLWGKLAPKRPFGPEQATGAPDTAAGGRPAAAKVWPTAWTPEASGGDAWLELEYAGRVAPIAILVHGAGSLAGLAKITAPASEKEEVVLWQPAAPGGAPPDVLVIPVTTAMPVARLKLHVAPDASGTAIDAVGLLDRSGLTHWAVSATASNFAAAPRIPVQLGPQIVGGPFGGRAHAQEGLRRRYGGVGTGEAVELGLDWLARHQTQDEGFWDCDGFGNRCEGEACDGMGYPLYDPGVTGLALLAFLGAGHTQASEEYGPTVGAGLKYLRRIQDPEGCFGTQTGHFMYNHAIATLAMAEAYGMTRSPLLRPAVENALAFLYRAQNPHPSGQGKLAWRYTVTPGDNDTCVTGWVVMVLKSAKLSGLEVPEEALAGARAWLDVMTDPDTGRVGYVQKGVSPVRAPGREQKWPRSRSEAITAVGMLSRILLGEDPTKSEVIQRGTKLCLERLPTWNESDGSIDHYYWYAGTLALFQIGGREWTEWNQSMKDALVDHQRQDGCARGSWDPIGPWGEDGGRVYSTALLTLCLEVYFRYGKVFGTK
ncbi:MAG: terpene cyclase/mutase family protein [Planctomycetes bacterium]|nr:terpene cyclase/mutase family protein [Planctomycetota bacterium]